MSSLEEMSLARGRYRLVMMSCGYVENACTAWLIFSTIGNERYATAAEAVMELALDLYAKYEEDHLAPNDYKQKCCREQTADVAFCPKCGTPLKAKPFIAEAFMDYVTNLNTSICDGYGESEGTATRSFAFWPWRAHNILGAAKDEVVFIGENAERVMLDALYEVREDLRDSFIDSEHEDWRTSTWKRVRQKGTTE